MASNTLKIFGSDLLAATRDNVASWDHTTGFAYDDATAGTITGYNKGLVPATAASSTIINTALRQGTYGAYILGKVIADLGLSNVGTDYIANTVAGTFTKFLSKLKYIKNNYTGGGTPQVDSLAISGGLNIGAAGKIKAESGVLTIDGPVYFKQPGSQWNRTKDMLFGDAGYDE